METGLSTIKDFNENEIQIIKNTVAKGVTDIELQYFLILAKSLGLNPFNKEIWCYKDGKGNVLIFTGRDGFLVAAQKQSVYGGLRSGYVCANDKVFSMDIPNAKVSHTFDNKARGAVMGGYAIAFRKGCEPTVEWADFATYNKGYNAWKSHPGAMIVKVAEANALKKAFGLAGVENEDTYDFKNESFAAPIDIEHEEEPITVPEQTEEELSLELEALINEADTTELLVNIFNTYPAMHNNKIFMQKLTERKTALKTVTV
jgi:phage recombination protein Bet